jgi:hypothetical protein
MEQDIQLEYICSLKYGSCRKYWTKSTSEVKMLLLQFIYDSYVTVLPEKREQLNIKINLIILTKFFHFKVSQQFYMYCFTILMLDIHFQRHLLVMN